MKADHTMQWDYLLPEELEALVAEHQAYFDFEAGDYSNAADLSRLLEYLQLYIYLRELESARALMPSIKAALDDALAAAPDDPTLPDYAVEWNLLAMRFAAPEADKLGELVFYRNIEALCAERGDAYEARLLQARLTLLANVENWLQLGGRPEALPDDEQEFLTDLQQNTEPHVQERIQAWEQAEAHVQALALKRALVRYYLMQPKPNEAIQLLKEMLTQAPLHPEFAETDLADINLEIGALLLNYKKYKAARQYLSRAYEIYAAAGEDFDMHAAQAEALEQECADFLDD